MQGKPLVCPHSTTIELPDKIEQAVNMKVLVAYASGHGSTAEVAQFIGERLKEYDFDVTISAVDAVQSAAGYDAYVIGSPIYGGMWLTEFSQFLERFETELASKPLYMWMMCIRILEKDGLEYAQQEYIYQPIVKKLGTREVQFFAGKLNLDKIDWEERWTLAARYEGEVLPGTRNDDYRDWNAIRIWAMKLRDELMPA